MNSVKYVELSSQQVKPKIYEYVKTHGHQKQNRFQIEIDNQPRTIALTYLKAPEIYQYTLDAVITDTYISPALLGQIDLRVKPH